MLIDKKATEILFRMFLSCAPLKECMPGMSGKPEKELFNKIKGATVNIDFSIFKRALEPQTFEKIQEFVRVSGKEIIDTNLIIQFFGGRLHLKKIIDQLKAEKVNDDFFLKTVFAHIGIPLEVTVQNGKTAEGIYRNGKLEVPIKNLVIFPGDFVKLGDIVVAHYALIISTSISRDAKTKILFAQRKNFGFALACCYLQKQGGLDYAEFLNLSEVTSDIIKNLY